MNVGTPTIRPYVALLRGVNNIGSARRVAMADLRAMFESLGFRDVRTLLNSGNVIFSVPRKLRGDIIARIEKALASRLGLNALVTVLAGDEVVAAVLDNPLWKVASNPSQLLIVVPRVASDLGRLKPLLEERWAPEAFAMGPRVAYLWCGNGIPKSRLWRAVDRALERSGTVRNLATLTKLKAMVEGAA